MTTCFKAIDHQDDKQAVLSTAEVMTVTFVAAEFFTGNQQKALDFLTDHHYIKSFSKSKFNRRVYALPEALWQLALGVLAKAHQNNNADRPYIVDTFPVPVCHNIATWVIYYFVMLSYFRGLRARRRAEALCRHIYPGEPLLGSWICADETDRFVVRVFYGEREWTGVKMPPWRECFIVAVDKATLQAVPVEEAASYQPVLR